MSPDVGRMILADLDVFQTGEDLVRDRQPSLTIPRDSADGWRICDATTHQRFDVTRRARGSANKAFQDTTQRP